MKHVELFSRLAALGIFGSTSTVTESIQQTMDFHDAVNNTITDLYLFRYNLQKVQESKEIEYALENINKSFGVFNASTLAVKEDSETTTLRIGLIANSIHCSLSRLVELLEKFNEQKIAWKKESTAATFTECKKIEITLNEQFDVIKSENVLRGNVEEKLEDLNKTLTTLQKLLQTS